MSRRWMMACAVLGLLTAVRARAQTTVGKTYSFTDRYAEKTVFFQVDFEEAQTFSAKLVETKKETPLRGDTLLLSGTYEVSGGTLYLKDRQTENRLTIVQEPQRIAVQGILLFPSRNTIILNHSNRWH